MFKPKNKHVPECDTNPGSSSDKIFTLLNSVEPCMIARFGSVEMNCLCNYIGIKKHKGKYIEYLKGVTPPWWWEPKLIKHLQLNAGFFPPTEEMIERFCELMLKDMVEVDLLGSWLLQESYFRLELESTDKVHLELLNPYFSKDPWTKALENKKILVIHPFATTIQKQYQKRDVLFADNLLPVFDLKVIPAVQSIAGEHPASFNDWFEALEYMKYEVDKVDFDICLIGCGAYGFPLAAHVKRMGKKGFHLGGSLQLLFGIKGKRWEKEEYNSKYNYSKLMNEHWVYPSLEETPKLANVVEGACYW